MQGCGSGSFLVGSGAKKISPGSGSYRYFGYVKLYKQEKGILKTELLHIFRGIFPFFQVKIINIKISEKI